MTVVKRNKRARPDPELLKLADSLLANYQKPEDLCKRFDSEHRLIPARRPQTNGMVERVNGRISGIVKQTRFSCANELESTLRGYLKIYNHNIPEPALNHARRFRHSRNGRGKNPDYLSVCITMRVLTPISP
jgi:transposase InsO family protein